MTREESGAVKAVGMGEAELAFSVFGQMVILRQEPNYQGGRLSSGHCSGGSRLCR